jgi:hypothetical protein
MQSFGRRFGLVFLVCVAIAIPLGLVGPTKPDTDGYDKATVAALSDADANEKTSSGAPQQQVVNGWLNRDLLLIQIKQTNDLLTLLHLVAALLIALAIATSLAMVWGGGMDKTRPNGGETAGPTRGPLPDAIDN